MSKIIIDVREPFEYQRGHVDGAINIPPTQLMAGAPELAEVPKDTELILYCVTGSRSRVATSILQQQGFTNVINGINKDHVKANYC
jgi:rhodanese-related sulfurtransferase